LRTRVLTRRVLRRVAAPSEMPNDGNDIYARVLARRVAE
jgi:hypothetical protein